MARPISTVGLRGEVTFGASGYLHADNNWRGATDTTAFPDGTEQPGISSSYSIGDIVVHNSGLWICVTANDNVEPGGTYDTDGTMIPDSATVQTYWEHIGNTNDTTYTAGNGLELNGTTFAVDLLEDGGLILTGATAGSQELGLQVSSQTGNALSIRPASGTNPGVFAEDTNTTEASTSIVTPTFPVSAMSVPGSGPNNGVLTLTFTGDEAEANLDTFFRTFGVPIGDNYSPAPNNGELTIPSNVTITPALVEVPRPGGSSVQFPLASGQTLTRTGAATIEWRGQGATGTTGTYNGVFPSVTAVTMIDNARPNEAERRLRFTDTGTETSVGNEVRIDQNNFVQINTRHDATLRVDGSNNLGANISTATGNRLSTSADGSLFVPEVDFPVDMITGSGPVTVVEGSGDNADQYTIGLRTDSSLHNNPDTSGSTPVNRLSVQVDTAATLNALAEGTAGLSVPVTTWARSDNVAAASDRIPLAKLPNLSLGNTHTYNSRADLIANNNEISAGSTAAPQIAWHTGDLAVITDQDTANAGIYVYVGANQVDENDNPVPAAFTDANFATMFRPVVSSGGNVQTTFTGGGVSNQALNNIEYNANTDLLEFTVAGETMSIDVGQTEPVASSVPTTNFFRKIKVGNQVFAFGDPSPQPRLTFNPSSRVLNLFSANDQTSTHGFTPLRGASDTTQNPISAANFDTPTITGADNTAVITGTNLVATFPASDSQVAAAGPFTITAQGDVTINNDGVMEAFNDVVATGTISVADNRRQPTILPRSQSRSSLMQGGILETIDFSGGGVVAQGTAFDSNTFMIGAGATARSANTFEIAASTSTVSVTASFPAPASRANGQTITTRNRTGLPADQTIVITRFDPWFIGTRSIANGPPTTSAHVLALPVQNNVFSPRNGFDVTGTVGDVVFMALRDNITRTPRLTLVSNGGITDGTLLPGRVEVTAATGTLTYRIYQFFGLDLDPTAVNITFAP